MNSILDLRHHPSITYYDSDYPSPITATSYPENFDGTTEYQGIAKDLVRYEEIACNIGGPVLELCCGTGRVLIPLARRGMNVVGVDVSSGMLEGARINLAREDSEVASRIELVEQDVTTLSLGSRRFRLAICAFNSLLCIVDFDAQLRVLERARAHLEEGGLLVLDIVNPLDLDLRGSSLPKAFFTRRNPHTGNRYTRFSMSDPIDEKQRQRLHGWYDEIDPDGVVHRTFYSMHWRPIFRYEIELMLRQSGFRLTAIEGGHAKEPFTASSPSMFIQAVAI